MAAKCCVFLLAATAVAAQAPTPAQITEPASGVRFDARIGDLQLLGTGLRTKTMLKVKVYALGLYVDPAGLVALKAQSGTPAFYQQLAWGDFAREIRMKFVRSSVSADQIRGAFRESLGGADQAKVASFLQYFGDTKAGDEYSLRWTPGVGLATTVAGQAKPPIADKAFAAAVFSIWLGEKPIQADIKRDLISRAAEVLR
jgi:hypothetical protein